LEAKQAGQTLYIDGKAVEPMFPAYLSTQKASLRADGVKRPVIARLYCIEDNHITLEHWALLNVAVSTAYTYDSVLENPDIVETLPHLLSIVTGKPHTTDSHEWVEQAMILYNTEVAKVLKNRRDGILRRHAGTTQQIYKEVAEKTHIKELAFLGASSGQYVSANSNDTYHAGLALDTYCHASSPLRRYADVVNHRWLKHFAFGFQMPYVTTIIEHLNHRNQAMKQFERLMWFLQHLNPDGSITTVDGIVLTYDEEKKSAKVYVPEWKRTVNAGHTTTQVYEPGTPVTIRAYSNLKATSIQQRVICSMN
jgi:exoribonuclease II